LGIGETWEFDHICHQRTGPRIAVRGQAKRAPFTEPGQYNVMVGDYGGRVRNFDQPPKVRSESYQILVREPIENEQNFGKHLTTPHAANSTANERWESVNFLREFAANHPDSPVIDHVHFALSRLLIRMSFTSNPKASDDYHLRAEGISHGVAIVPERSILYRQTMTAPFLSYLSDWRLHDHVDVGVILEKLRHSPPFSETPQFTSHRRLIEAQVKEVEASVKARKDRRFGPDRKITYPARSQPFVPLCT
jgi:hypothetical protein